eukprot:scpid106922/ scgid0826/ 
MHIFYTSSSQESVFSTINLSWLWQMLWQDRAEMIKRRSRTDLTGSSVAIGWSSFLQRRKKSAPTKKCVVCAPAKRKESRYQCKTCPSHPGLCVVPCFEHFHSKANYHYVLSAVTCFHNFTADAAL